MKRFKSNEAHIVGGRFEYGRFIRVERRTGGHASREAAIYQELVRDLALCIYSGLGASSIETGTDVTLDVGTGGTELLVTFDVALQSKYEPVHYFIGECKHYMSQGVSQDAVLLLAKKAEDLRARTGAKVTPFFATVNDYGPGAYVAAYLNNITLIRVAAVTEMGRNPDLVELLDYDPRTQFVSSRTYQVYFSEAGTLQIAAAWQARRFRSAEDARFGLTGS